MLLAVWPFLVYSQKQISAEDYTTRQTFASRSVNNINWMRDGKFYTALAGNKVIKYDVTTGLPVETIVDGSQLTPAIEIDDYSFSMDEGKLLLRTRFEPVYRHSYTAEYYVFDRTTREATRLSPNGRQSYATFSPDGSRIAFVRSNNLFFVAADGTGETRVTADGAFNKIINGTTDWVYEEEFSFVVGFFWSPDSRKLAYYKFDESQVKEYNLQRWNRGELYPEDYRFKYPKAGERNSVVQIWIHDIVSGRAVRADTGDDVDSYIPRVTWTRDPEILSIRKLNRLQNRLQIFHANATSGKVSVILDESSPAYVDLEFTDDLSYLADGRHFIHTSEKDGYKQLYLYSVDGNPVRKLPTGDHEVSEFIGFDERSRTFYYTSAEPSELERHFYSLSFDGKKKARLTQAAGIHNINMSSDFQFYIDHYSSAQQPVVVSLHRTKGNQQIKVLEDNRALAHAAAEYALAQKEFFRFKGADGSELNAFFLKPADFSPVRKYPVVLYQYSGPGSQNVLNQWGGSHFYFHQMLAQKGYLVAVIDTRGTGGRGEAFRKQTYKQLGRLELEDVLAFARHLGSLPYADTSRLGIWGWSYGGYMSSLAMTKGAGVFKAGVAVAPVTNWRFYDTIYTERYLQTPQLNPAGYDDNSPLTHAAKLQGAFLLVHGTGDDNVHVQNSMVFQAALIRAGKQFESFYYPDKTHSIAGSSTRLHLYSMLASFFDENL